MKLVYTGIICLLCFSACQTQQKTTADTADTTQAPGANIPQQGAGGTLLLTGRWNIVTIDKATVQNAAPYIEFKNDTVIGGKAGCNSFGGRYALQGSSIRFENIFSTKMACDADKMKTESQLLNYFNGKELLVEKRGAGELIFKNAAGDVLIEMRRE